MSNWQLTKGLQNLRAQANVRWPNRDHASDGTIGDAAHQAEAASGHNPDDTPGSHASWNADKDKVPEVRAFDMDSDLREPGTTAQMVVDHVRSLPHVADVIRYMIYNHKMYHSRDGFSPTPYKGASGHEEHIHFEQQWTDAADNNDSFDFKFDQVGKSKEDTVSVADAKQGFAEALADMATTTNASAKDDDKWGGQVNANFRRVVNAAVEQSAVAADVKALKELVMGLSAKLDALKLPTSK